MKRLLITALLATPFLLWSQTTTPAPATEEKPDPKLTEQQTAAILKQLDTLDKQITLSRGDTFGKALVAFKTAMAGDKEARELYMSCYKLNHFERADSKEADFKAWKDKNEAKFKDPEFLVGIRYQLEYLVLTLQAQDAKDAGKLIPALKDFMNKELAAVDATYKHNTNGAVQVIDKTKTPKTGQPAKTVRTGGGSNELVQILDKSVKNCEFAKAYLLDEYFRNKNWEYQPLDFRGIYNSTILPYAREKKPADLAAQWDACIAIEFQMQKITRSESEYLLFYRERFPERQWDKSKDLLDSKIDPIKALADLLKIVRDNPTHPRAAEWLKELRENVNQFQSPATPSVSAVPATETK